MSAHSLTLFALFALFALPGACDVTLGSTSRPATSQPPCLSRKPNARVATTPIPTFSKCWASPPHLAKVGLRQKTYSTMARIFVYKSSFRFCSSVSLLNSTSHSSSQESLSHGPFHTLKLGSLPLSMRWFLTFAIVHKVRPLHLAQGKCSFFNVYNLTLCSCQIHNLSSLCYYLFG